MLVCVVRLLCFTSDTESQIWAAQLLSTTDCSRKSYQHIWHLHLAQSAQHNSTYCRVSVKVEEMRKRGWPRHERSSTETRYYQLLPQNIRDTAISRANNHTICWEGSWVQWLTMTVTSLPVVPVLPLWRFPTNCRPKARYEHQICE